MVSALLYPLLKDCRGASTVDGGRARCGEDQAVRAQANHVDNRHNNKLTMKYSPWNMVISAIKKMDRWANSKPTSKFLAPNMLRRMGAYPGWGGVSRWVGG